MKFKLETVINKPRADVWQAFDNIENLQKWQPTLIKQEFIEGIPGQVGAVSKLTFEESGREFSLTEKIAHRDAPNQLDSIYENNFADNTIKNKFIEQGTDQTSWVTETEFTFKTFLMKIMGNALKKNYIKRTQRDMQRFKEMVESL
jgi:uncharacterized protein YndB with AHSA1/START domain